MIALLVSVLLLAGNAFFVAAEFALVAARRHRLERAAEDGSRGARAAVAGVRQLSLMLAGAQLGITLCTLGLGALAEPAVAHLLEPLLLAAGLPPQVSYAIAFGIALALVVFLHMVVGEMAPKSWAITDPQRAAILLAVPFQAFTRLARPAIAGLNGLANAVLRLIRVEPQNELAQAHRPEELRLLLDASREHSLLPPDAHELLSRVLRLRDTTVETAMTPRRDAVTVAADASAFDVEETGRATGRSRLLVLDPDGGVAGVVQVRDAVRATTRGRPVTAAALMVEAHTVRVGDSVLTAIRDMREAHAQLAVVVDHGPASAEAGAVPVGVIALEDLLEQVIGEFDDETDVRV